MTLSVDERVPEDVTLSDEVAQVSVGPSGRQGEDDLGLGNPYYTGVKVASKDSLSDTGFTGRFTFGERRFVPPKGMGSRRDPVLLARAAQKGAVLGSSQRIYETAISQGPAELFENVVGAYEFIVQDALVNQLPQTQKAAFGEDRKIFEAAMRAVLEVVEAPIKDASGEDTGEVRMVFAKLPSVSSRLEEAADALDLMCTRLSVNDVVIKGKDASGKAVALPFGDARANSVVKAFGSFADYILARRGVSDKALSSSAEQPDSLVLQELEERRQQLEAQEALLDRKLSSSHVIMENWENALLLTELEKVKGEVSKHMTAEVIFWVQDGLPRRPIDEGIVQVALNGLEQTLILEASRDFDGTTSELNTKIKSDVLETVPFSSIVKSDPRAAEELNKMSIQELLRYKLATQFPDQLDMLQVIAESYSAAQQHVRQDFGEVLGSESWSLDLGRVRTMCAGVLHAGLLGEFGLLQGDSLPPDAKYFADMERLHNVVSRLTKIDEIQDDAKKKQFATELQNSLSAALTAFEATLAAKTEVSAVEIDEEGSTQGGQQVLLDFSKLRLEELENIRCVGGYCFADRDEAVGSFLEDHKGSKFVVEFDAVSGNRASNIVRGTAVQSLGIFDREKYENLGKLLESSKNGRSSATSAHRDILELLK